MADQHHFGAWLTDEQIVAVRPNISRGMLDRWAEQKKFPVSKFGPGQRRHYRLEDIDKFLDSLAGVE